MPRHRPPSRALVVAGLVLLALGACSHEGASPEPEPPPPFALAAAEASRHLDQPAIALRFTRALAAEQDFEACVRVEAEGLGRIAASPLLDPIGQALVVPWLEGGREYRIELCPELKAVDGERLGRAVTTRAVAGTPPPVLAFASAGSVLPAHADAGLPLRSFGVAAVDVDFFRVRPSHLPALLVAGPRPGTREAHELKELLPALELAYSGRFDLPQTAEGPVVARAAGGQDRRAPPRRASSSPRCVRPAASRTAAR
ncbi:MAG: hypothetical protein RML12_08685 [Xanthomonadales bacterium]|nr:hypothetical protein [Xanthomonadales bacterium]